MMELSDNLVAVKQWRYIRCVNIDWLEVHTREPAEQPHDANYFREQGYSVEERPYGTRVYKEMFTLMYNDGLPFLEIRRNPYSSGVYGIHDSNECHIRLVNRTCYETRAALILRDFMVKYGYGDYRITRIDLCMDFTEFDEGDKPDAFLRRYLQHTYAKINQGNIDPHGKDAWEGQNWNSIAWGSNVSCVRTKMYNKTEELFNPRKKIFEKPYIRQAWYMCGFIDNIMDCTKNGSRVDVWRVEFSIKSGKKKWFTMELDGKRKKKQSMLNTLEVYQDRGQILVMFASLARHYFRFKIYQEGVRKDRCKEKLLFNWKGINEIYKLDDDKDLLGVEKSTESVYDSLVRELHLFKEKNPTRLIDEACGVILTAIDELRMKRELAHPWSHEEMQRFLQLEQIVQDDAKRLQSVSMDDVMKVLRITKRILDLSEVPDAQ